MSYYKELKQILVRILKSDFDQMNKEEIEEKVNELFLAYKQFLGKNSEDQSSGILLESLEKVLHKEDVIVSYAYGAYISNRIAHDILEKKNPITEQKILIHEDLKFIERRKQLRKYAFASKDMFIQFIIEQAKQSPEYEVCRRIDEQGKAVLEVNLTNYYAREHSFKSDVVISMHIAESYLSHALKTLQKGKVVGNKKIDEILNRYDLEDR